MNHEYARHFINFNFANSNLRTSRKGFYPNAKVENYLSCWIMSSNFVLFVWVYFCGSSYGQTHIYPNKNPMRILKSPQKIFSENFFLQFSSQKVSWIYRFQNRNHSSAELVQKLNLLAKLIFASSLNHLSMTIINDMIFSERGRKEAETKMEVWLCFTPFSKVCNLTHKWMFAITRSVRCRKEKKEDCKMSKVSP